MVGSSLPREEWVHHLVVPGERLKEIGERYAVSVASIVRWNKLDPDHPRLRAGSRLRVKTALDLPQRKRKVYKVRKGDTWARIADRHNVPTSHVQKRWNPKLDTLKPGDRVILWVDEEPQAPEADESESDSVEVLHAAHSVAAATVAATVEDVALEPPELDGTETTVAGLPIVEVPPSSRSVGRPGYGRISSSRPLPQNPKLYSIRSPAHAHATSHTIMQLQTAIANFRASTGFSRELLILDISRKNGGRLRPHRSHRSGRDVDIRLPLAPGVPEGTVPIHAYEVDWDMTWALINSLIETDEIVYIFLSRSRQRYLHAAAERAGVAAEDLVKHIQYPGTARLQTVRHAAGHEKHIHVRFKCAPDSERCRD